MTDQPTQIRQALDLSHLMTDQPTTEYWPAEIEPEPPDDKRDRAITDYWFEHYATECCTICGNSGVIDSRGIKTAAGVEVGRLNYCICPNGQALRNGKADLLLRVGDRIS